MTMCDRFIPTPDSAQICSLDHGSTVFADEQFFNVNELEGLTQGLFSQGDFAIQIYMPR